MATMEYVLVATFVAMVVVVSGALLGGKIATALTGVSDAIGAATGQVAHAVDPHCNYHAWGVCHGQNAGGNGTGNGDSR